jgi:O-methyltransferase involved in polyketide biosynthesis
VAGTGSHSADLSGNGPPKLDTTVPHPARMYDYWLGGKDNFAVDREAAEWSAAASAGGMCRARETVRANRAFLGRAVRYLAGQAGIRQFLDIGTGLPAADNTHEAAQGVAPQSRIVYVDNDPVVLSHARALLTSTPEGATAYLAADLRDPDAIVHQAASTLDFGEPLALMLLAVLQFIPGTDAYRIVARLVDAVPSGSYLVVSHPTGDLRPGDAAEFQERYNQSSAAHLCFRTKAEVAQFFGGLDLLEPGVVQADLWRPSVRAAGRTTSTNPTYCGVGKKP